MIIEQGQLFSPYIGYQDGGRYQLYYDAFFALPEMEGFGRLSDAGSKRAFSARYLRFQGDHLEIKAGYAWDGPSGPALHTRCFMRSSLVHDALYDLIRQGSGGVFGPSRALWVKHWRKQADLAMFRLGREDGMWQVRAWWTYLGVRLFGWYAVRSDSSFWPLSDKNDVHVAPRH